MPILILHAQQRPTTDLLFPSFKFLRLESATAHGGAGGWAQLQLTANVVVVEEQQLLHELEVGVREVRLVVVKLQVLLLNDLPDRLRYWTALLECLCRRKEGDM